MRNSDIETLEKVVTALEEYLPCGKMSLLTEFSELYVRLKSQNDRQKQGYDLRKKAKFGKGKTPCL